MDLGDRVSGVAVMIPRARITDGEALSKITRVMAEDYLAKRGWQRRELVEGRYSIWDRGMPLGSEFDLLLCDDAPADRVAMHGQMISRLSRLERRSEVAIYLDMIGAPDFKALLAELVLAVSQEYQSREERASIRSLAREARRIAMERARNALNG